MPFEHRKQPLLKRREFLRRQMQYFFYSGILLAFSLGIGVLGYKYFGGISWIDSLLNASMILTGMGPVSEMHSDAAKLFSSFYALYSGIAFLGTVAVFFAPIAHRFMHILHMDPEEK